MLIKVSLSTSLILAFPIGDVAELLTSSVPAWDQLRSATAHQLLQRLPALLEDSGALTHIMPWLWALADEDTCSVEVDPDAQADILRSLSSMCGPNDTPVASKVWACSLCGCQQLCTLVCMPADPE